MIKQYFAHTLPDKPPAAQHSPGKIWQPLEQHLKETAENAKGFASAFEAVHQVVKKVSRPNLPTR